MPPCPTQSSCRWQCHCNANIGIETFFSTEATTESLYPLPLAFFHLIRASKVELRLWARPLAWKAKFSPALFSTHPWDGEIALSFIQPFWQKEVSPLLQLSYPFSLLALLCTRLYSISLRLRIVLLGRNPLLMVLLEKWQFESNSFYIPLELVL